MSIHYLSADLLKKLFLCVNMETAALMEIIGIIVLMSLWLALVLTTATLLAKRRKLLDGTAKKSYGFLFEAFVIIFIGDFLHTIGAVLNVAFENGKADQLNIFGGTAKIYSFTLFFDGLAFILFYLMWAFFVIYRYQEGKYTTYDKIVVIVGLLAIFFMLTSPYIETNAVPYYEVAWYGPHMILFVLLGGMVVGKLMTESYKRKKTGENQSEEKYLFLTAWGFVFSFVFFILTIVLLPIDTSYGMFMIPKTFAYAFALICLIKGLLWKKS